MRNIMRMKRPIRIIVFICSVTLLSYLWVHNKSSQLTEEAVEQVWLHNAPSLNKFKPTENIVNNVSLLKITESDSKFGNSHYSTPPVHYKSSPQTKEIVKEIWLNNVSLLHKVAENDSNYFKFSDSRYSTLLHHKFPNCHNRNIYNGNAGYSLPGIIKFIRKYIPPPADFVGHLKNPCWLANYDKMISDLNLNGYATNKTPNILLKTNGTKTLYCLPYMYLLGYPKCGTTSLFSYFKNHSDFIESSPRYGWIGIHASGLVNKYPANLKSVFDLLSGYHPAARELELNSANYHVDTKIIADINSGNGWRLIGYEQFKTGSICDPPLLLRELQPNAKFVVLLREPISRLLSAFWYYANINNYEKHLNPDIFAEDVQTFFKCLELCEKRKSMLQCLREAEDFDHNIKDEFRFKENPQQFFSSFYYITLLPWLQVFPRKNFLFVRTEDMKNDAEKVLQNIFKFLGMSPLPKSKMATTVHHNYNAQLKMSYITKANMSLSPSAKKQLRSYFRPFNEKLAELVNDERFLWDDTD